MEAQKFKPIKKNVLIQAYEWPEKTKSGIYIPDMLKYNPDRGGNDPWRGKILAIGSEVEQVCVGEIVRYQPGNYNNSTITLGRIRYVFLDELLIYAVEDIDEVIIRALKNRIVFLPDESLEKKYGSLYLPQRREEHLLYGTIVRAGEGTEVCTGDKIVIENKSTWQYFDSAGKRYILTDKFNILAKLGDELPDEQASRT